MYVTSMNLKDVKSEDVYHVGDAALTRELL